MKLKQRHIMLTVPQALAIVAVFFLLGRVAAVLVRHVPAQ
jgi:hypothetical protein